MAPRPGLPGAPDGKDGERGQDERRWRAWQRPAMRLGLPVCAIGAAGALGYVLCADLWVLPSPGEMEAYLRRHRQKLEETVQVLSSGEAAAAPQAARLIGELRDSGVARWVECGSAGARCEPVAGTDPAGAGRDAPGSVLFYTHVRGVGVGAYGVGLAWCPRPPTPLSADREAMLAAASQREGFVGFRALGGPWYEFLWEAD